METKNKYIASLTLQAKKYKGQLNMDSWEINSTERAWE